MSEMVERCVKAVEECAWDWREQASEEKIVRAVIAAMRDPTEAMEKAGARVWDADWCAETSAFNTWHAMIDEALK